MLNELVVTRTTQQEWVNEEDMNRMLELLDNPNAPGHDMEIQPRGIFTAMASPLLCALVLNERLDLRPKLRRLGIFSVDEFLSAVEGADTLSVINIPINKSLRASKDRPIGVDTLKQIRDHIVIEKSTVELEGCKLFGQRGSSWDEVVGGSKKEGFAKLLKQFRVDGSKAADVIYLRGEISTPLIVGVPCCGQREFDGDEVRGGADLNDPGTLQLVEAIAKRFVATCGTVPHIVLCTLHPSKVNCSASLSEGVNLNCDSSRSQEAWSNYHTLIEVAKSRVMSVEHPNAVFVELHSTGSERMKDESLFHLGYGLAVFPLRSAIESSAGADANAQTKSKGNTAADDKAIVATFASFDRDGSGEIDKNELQLVAKELGVPMTDTELDEAMLQMDADGSGEVDLPEFTKWYKSLSVQQPGQRLSKIDLIRIRSIMAESSISALSQRHTEAPADALVGPSSLGAMMDQYGCAAAPSLTNTSVDSGSALVTRYIPGGYSIQAHGSKDSCCNCDAVHVQVPSKCWTDEPAAMVAQATAGAASTGTPIQMWAVRLSDALLCWMATNFGFQSTPGQGQVDGVKTNFKGGRRASVYTNN